MHSQPRLNAASIPPLVVDLDGCLIQTDLLLESSILLLKKSPIATFYLPFWLFRGKAYLKRRIAERIKLEAQFLPYHSSFLEYLREQHKAGRLLVLATASDERLAVEVAEHLAMFDVVLASDGYANGAGERKLLSLIERYGRHGFDYAGNAKIDLIIWRHAREAIIVSSRRHVQRLAGNLMAVRQVFYRASPSVKDYLKALRVHQWLKNVLLFVPLFTAHAWRDVFAASHALLAFIAFCLCASSTYIFNDLLDLQSDRKHPNKRNRPFASGAIPVTQGITISVVVMVIGLVTGSLVNLRFFALLSLYIGITTAYSLHLKSYVLIDVMVLAGLYTLRIIAGGVATQIPISFWLLAFGMFLFVSLAILKRYSELRLLAQANQLAADSRDYQVSDLLNLSLMGIASGYLAVLVFALYLQNPELTNLYTHQELLWLLCPAFFYWVSRMWLKASRGEMHDDPLVFAVYDRGSRCLCMAVFLIVFFAL